MNASVRKLARISSSLALLLLLTSAQACARHSSLHASHGQRLHDILNVQQSMHASRPVNVRGEEVTRLLGRHDKQFERELQAARQTASQSNLGAGMMNH